MKNIVVLWDFEILTNISKVSGKIHILNGRMIARGLHTPVMFSCRITKEIDGNHVAEKIIQSLHDYYNVDVEVCDADRDSISKKLKDFFTIDLSDVPFPPIEGEFKWHL